MLPSKTTIRHALGAAGLAAALSLSALPAQSAEPLRFAVTDVEGLETCWPRRAARR